MKRPQPKLQCFRCWFKNEECPKGTISGSCIRCGGCGGGTNAIVESYGNFFSEPLTAFLSRIAESLSIPLGSGDFFYNVLQIDITTPIASSNRHIFEVHGNFDASNAQLEQAIDEMVWVSYTSDIRETDAVASLGSLVRKATHVRGYLALLFAIHITDQRKILQDGVYKYENIYGSDLSLHLTNFILFRLNRLIPEVMNSVAHKGRSSNRSYMLDAEAASAVLYTALVDVCDGLARGRLKPLCGGPDLAHILLQQIQPITMQLEHHLVCDSDWAGHLKGPLDNLRSITMVIKMVLTVETRFHDTANSSPTSFSSTTIDENTPASSTDQQSISDIDLDDWFASGSHMWSSMAGLIPSATPNAPQFNLAAAVTGKLASKVSDPSDLNTWISWPEQNTLYVAPNLGHFDKHVSVPGLLPGTVYFSFQ